MSLQVLLSLLVVVVAVSSEIRIPGLSKSKGLTDAEMQAMIDEHNELRKAIANGYKGHGPAADMLRMEFLRDSQINAQKQASWCNGPPHGNVDGEGQNYAYGNGASIMKGAIDGWFHKELPYYQFGGPVNKKNGHYTQMIWASSYQIGCGSQDCGRGTRLVCNYKPPGNYRGKMPYTKGPACSACPSSHPYCLDSLCSSAQQCRGKNCKCTMTRSQCRNGDFDAQKCSCSCKQGFTGRNCDEECKDDPDSGCYYRAKQGQCKKGSATYSNMMEKCKASCKICLPVCKDTDAQCDLFKKGGQCGDPFVPKVCAKTCGYCK